MQDVKSSVRRQGRLPKRVWAGFKRRVIVVWELTEATVSGFSKDRGELLAAALAFFTLLSIAPLIIIAVAIAGAILGEGAARQEIDRALRDTMVTGAAESVGHWVDQARASGGLASVIGVVLLLFGASRVTSQLRSALNQIWNVRDADEEGFRASVRGYLMRRLFAFGMVIASGPLLLAVFASRTALEALGGWLSSTLPAAAPVIVLMQPLLALAVVASLTAVVFKVVPDTRVSWRSAWVGAALTSVLFNAGNYVVALYLARAGITQTYGAAASVVVVLLWLYFSAQLFLIGAEFTQVYRNRQGREISGERRREPQFDERRDASIVPRVGRHAR
jgi:membrane protein